MKCQVANSPVQRRLSKTAVDLRQRRPSLKPGIVPAEQGGTALEMREINVLCNGQFGQQSHFLVHHRNAQLARRHPLGNVNFDTSI